MRFHYYPETDSLYLDLTETPSLDSREVAPGVVLDFGANGRLVGIDVDQASKFVNLSHLEAEALPMASFSWLAGQTRASSVLEPGGTILHDTWRRLRCFIRRRYINLVNGGTSMYRHPSSKEVPP